MQPPSSPARFSCSLEHCCPACCRLAARRASIRWRLCDMNDLKFAFRQLLKNPGFTAVAVLTLALGIGANTAIFQLLNAVRLKTLPVARPQELVEVRITGGNPGLGIFDGDNPEMTYPLWEQIQKHHEPISRIFAWSSGELPIGNEVEARMVRC